LKSGISWKKTAEEYRDLMSDIKKGENSTTKTLQKIGLNAVNILQPYREKADQDKKRFLEEKGNYERLVLQASKKARSKTAIPCSKKAQSKTAIPCPPVSGRGASKKRKNKAPVKTPRKSSPLTAKKGKTSGNKKIQPKPTFSLKKRIPNVFKWVQCVDDQKLYQLSTISDTHFFLQNKNLLQDSFSLDCKKFLVGQLLVVDPRDLTEYSLPTNISWQILSAVIKGDPLQVEYKISTNSQTYQVNLDPKICNLLQWEGVQRNQATGNQCRLIIKPWAQPLPNTEPMDLIDALFVPIFEKVDFARCSADDYAHLVKLFAGFQKQPVAVYKPQVTPLSKIYHSLFKESFNAFQKKKTICSLTSFVHGCSLFDAKNIASPGGRINKSGKNSGRKTHGDGFYGTVPNVSRKYWAQYSLEPEYSPRFEVHQNKLIQKDKGNLKIHCAVIFDAIVGKSCTTYASTHAPPGYLTGGNNNASCGADIRVIYSADTNKLIVPKFIFVFGEIHAQPLIMESI